MRAQRGNDLGHQADVVGLAIGVGGHRHGQTLHRQVGHQDLATDDFAGLAPHRLEPFGNLLQLLAVQDGDPHPSQRGGDPADRVPFGHQRSHQLGHVFKEAQAQGDRQPPQLTVRGFHAGRQFPLLFGTAKKSAAHCPCARPRHRGSVRRRWRSSKCPRSCGRDIARRCCRGQRVSEDRPRATKWHWPGECAGRPAGQGPPKASGPRGKSLQKSMKFGGKDRDGQHGHRLRLWRNRHARSPTGLPIPVALRGRVRG